MKVIIAGSREPLGHANLKKVLMTIGHINRSTKPWISEVVSGGQTGIDAAGELWSVSALLREPKVFEAEWERYKIPNRRNPAGPIRNRQMAEYADAVILFPGGKGTASMKREAQKAGIKIIEVGEI